MALKNLFDMVKADRYTADGREAIIKAQEAETEDKVYQIGEISQKTGLQKTANGWVKPKKGAAPAKKENPTRTFEFKAGPDGNPVAGSGKEVKTYKTKKEAEAALKKQNAAAGSKPAAENKTTIRQGPKTKTLNETPAEHVQKNLDAYKGYQPGDMEELVLKPSGYEKQISARVPGGGQSITYTKNGAEDITLFFDKDGELENADVAESKPAEPQRSEAYKRGEKLAKPAEQRQSAGYRYWQGVLSGYDDESLLEQRKSLQEQVDDFEDDIKRYDKQDMANAVYAKRIDTKNFQIGALKAIDEEMESRGMDPAPRTSVPDAAPRVLTGDCKIRVRKA